MCRLLGITNFDYGKHEHLVLNFCELARSGNVMAGDPPGHGDGWGLAFYEGGELNLHKSGGDLLEESGEVIERLRRVGESPVMILHLRKSAWKDTTSTRHAHPFRYGNVAFAHNGVVYGYENLVPEIEIPGLAEDALDTEVFFYHFMNSHVQSQGNVGLGQAFLDTVANIRAGYRFSALNCLFSDGAALYALRDYSKEPDYYSLYKAFAGTSGIVSSQPLDDDFLWTPMEKGEYLVIPVA